MPGYLYQLDPVPSTTADLIQYCDGRPVIMHDGRPVSQAAYCDYITWNDWKDRVLEFIESGVTVYYLSPTPEETGPCWGFPVQPPREGEWRPHRLPLAEQAAFILAHVPDALFVIRFSSTVPKAWAEAHPAEMQTDEDGKTYADASLASNRYLRDVAAFCGALVRWCEGMPWGDRIVGYLDAPYGEGLLPLNCFGKFFDCSPANAAGFRAWARERYATDAALAAAWGADGLTHAAVSVPTDRAWRERRRAAAPTLKGDPVSAKMPANVPAGITGYFHWLEAGNAPREQDYCRFMRDAFTHKFTLIARAIKHACAAVGVTRLVGFDVSKQPLMGWPILSNFDGIGDIASFPHILLLSGSWDVGRLLDEPAIDLIFTPADYTARTVGFAYEAEGLTDSLLLRGKTMVIENDARCYVGAGAREQGAFRTEKEVEAGLLRNAALTLSRGIQSYWCNVGSSYFHDPGIHRTIATLVPMLDRLNTAPHRETRDAVALIIDDESALFEDFTGGYQALSVIWQRVLGLAHCGVPYRIFLLSDLAKASFPPYKVYLFPNLFVVDDRVMALLRATVLRDGNLAIFGPATGIHDGAHLSADGATRLFNVEMELIPRTTVRHVIVQDHGHPISAELPASLTYGDRMAYGPTLVPQEWAVENAGGVPLGHANACWFIHRTGLFLKEMGAGAAGNGAPGARGAGDYALLFSSAMPLPANLLRAAARYAGCHIWCEQDDVIYASDAFVALHSVKAGPRVIALPRPCTVTNALTREVIGDPLTEIRVTVSPPETFLFTLSG
ncbi:MAG TPA: hypothetical protein PLZ36_05865 [Armatimonadota bacterium]|nr:hypothetical protein [Armatimonadota bacterium]